MNLEFNDMHLEEKEDLLFTGAESGLICAAISMAIVLIEKEKQNDPETPANIRHMMNAAETIIQNTFHAEAAKTHARTRFAESIIRLRKRRDENE